MCKSCIIHVPFFLKNHAFVPGGCQMYVKQLFVYTQTCISPNILNIFCVSKIVLSWIRSEDISSWMYLKY